LESPAWFKADRHEAGPARFGHDRKKKHVDTMSLESGKNTVFWETPAAYSIARGSPPVINKRQVRGSTIFEKCSYTKRANIRDVKKEVKSRFRTRFIALANKN